MADPGAVHDAVSQDTVLGRSTVLAGSTVLIAGASSASGVACARALTEAGVAVVAVGTDLDRLDAGMAGIEGASTVRCDLTDPEAVRRLRKDLADDGTIVNGVVHLVGGWRGGQGLTGQSDEDWDVLHRAIITTLRNVSRVFYDDVEASARGRYVIVSATAAAHPTAGGANYAAAKAAAEAWIMAMADGLRKAQSGRKENPVAQHSAAAALVIKALLDDGMIAAQPERKFPGYTHVDELAAAVVRFFDADAGDVSGRRILLAD